MWRTSWSFAILLTMDHILLIAAKGAAKAAAASSNSKRHEQEIGLAIALIGGAVVALSGILGVRSMSRVAERSTMIVAGILLAIGFLIQLLALHGGGK